MTDEEGIMTEGSVEEPIVTPVEEKPKKRSRKAKAEAEEGEEKPKKRSRKAKAEAEEKVAVAASAVALEEAIEEPVIVEEPVTIEESPVEESTVVNEPETVEEPEPEVATAEEPVDDSSSENTEEKNSEDSSEAAEVAAAAGAAAAAGVAAGAAAAEGASPGASMAENGPPVSEMMDTGADGQEMPADEPSETPVGEVPEETAEESDIPSEGSDETSSENEGPVNEPEAAVDADDSKHEERSDRYTHRNVRYKPSSWFKQMLSVMKLELRMNLKKKGPIALIIGLVLMAYLSTVAIGGFIAMFIGSGIFPGLEDLYGGRYVELVLFLLPPVFAIHIARMSNAIPQDFDKNLAFIYLTQPVSRSALYIGRFIAAFIPLIVMVLTAFSVANVMSMKAGGISMIVMSKGMLTCILGGFAMGSMIFWMSAKSKKGKSVSTFMLVFMVIPMIYFVVGLLPLIKPDLDTQIMDIIDVIKSYVLYIPAFAPDLALLQIGGGGYSFSVFGFYSMMSAFTISGNNSAYAAISNIGIIPLYAVYIVWGVLFIFLGIRRYRRREM